MTTAMIRSFAVFCLLAAGPALAWGGYAHALTARIAQAQLTPSARAQIRQLLRAEPQVNTPGCALASLEDAAVWPDCVRSLAGDRFGVTASWHYQNISVCAAFDINANCPNGDCVTVQIARQMAVLADRRGSDAQRLQALAFVVHLVGDMHMPLHIGDKADRGGNDVRAAYGYKSPDRMNLHRAWDSDLAERALTEPPAIGPASITAAQRRAYTAGAIGTPQQLAEIVAGWAREGWEISRSIAYPALPDYPDTCPILGAPRTKARAIITPAYITAATPALRMQVSRAGSRIALLINQALTPTAPTAR